MKEIRPSLAYRLSWLFPAVGVMLLGLFLANARLFHVGDPHSLWGGIVIFACCVGYAVLLAKDTARRRD